MSQRKIVDFYMKEAHKLGYLARSAFKLQELQKRYRVVDKGGRVLDLGCHPGAWLQVASAAAGPSGFTVGIDLQPTVVPGKFCVPGQVATHKADVFKLSPAKLLAVTSPGGFTTVLSDLLHNTTGDASVDVPRSIGFAERALELAVGAGALWDGEGEGRGPVGGVLRPGGNLVAKVLTGAGVDELRGLAEPLFGRLLLVRVAATRKQSREQYLVGLGLKDRYGFRC